MKLLLVLAAVLCAAVAVHARSLEAEQADVAGGLDAKNAKTFTTPSGSASGKPKITVISNNNVLHQVIPRAGLDKGSIREQQSKEHKEEFSKQNGEQRRKSAKESLQKREAEASLRRQQLREQMVKKQQEEARQKAANEKVTKAKQRAERRREREEKASQRREQARKKAERRRERRRKQARRKAQERREKARRRRHERNRKRREELSAKKYEGEKKRVEERRRKAEEFVINSQGGWRNYGHSYAPATVRRVGRLCFVQGLLAGHGGLIGTLPAPCRPSSGRLIFALVKGDRPARVDVLQDGRVFHIAGGGGHWLSLSGIVFAVDDNAGRLTLQNNWLNYGHGYRPTQLARTRGMCVLSGLIRNGAWSNLAAASDDCRIDQRVIFSANNHENIARVDVFGNQIAWVGGYQNHGWVSFDGAIWSPQTGNQLSLHNNWQNYGHGYRPASFTTHGKVCIVSGLIKSGHWQHHVTTLPENCRPSARLIFGTNVHTSSARVDVLPDGQVHFITNKQQWEWLSLDGIAFVTN